MQEGGEGDGGNACKGDKNYSLHELLQPVMLLMHTALPVEQKGFSIALAELLKLYTKQAQVAVAGCTICFFVFSSLHVCCKQYTAYMGI